MSTIKSNKAPEFDFRTFQKMNLKPFNILLFGGSGTGKSSIIKSAMAVAKNQKLKSIDFSDNDMVRSYANDAEHLTQVFKKYSVSEKLFLWDTWGWVCYQQYNISNVCVEQVEQSNYSIESFSQILDGYIAEGAHEKLGLKPSMKKEANVIDAVIFVITCEADVESQAQKLQPFLKKACDMVCILFV